MIAESKPFDAAEQRINFVFANLVLSNPDITIEDVRKAADELQRRRDEQFVQHGNPPPERNR